MKDRIREWFIVVLWSVALVTLYNWYGGASVMFLILLSASVIMGGLVLQLFGAHHIEMSRHIHPAHLTVGSEIEVEVSIQFRSLLPLAWISVTDGFTEGSYQQLLFPGWGRSFTYKYYLQNVPRGIFAIHQCQVEWGGLFGFFKKSYSISCDERIIVIPLSTTISSEEGWTSKDAGMGEMEGFQQRRSMNHWGQEVRDYTQGDPLSGVHWKSTARLGRLQVRLPEEQVDHQCCIILDPCEDSYLLPDSLSAAGHDVAKDSFEWAVSIATGIVQESNTTGMDVELICGERHDKSSARTVTSQLTTLATVQLNGTRSVVNLVEEALSRLSRATKLIMITGRLDQHVTRALANFRHQGFEIDVYSLHPLTSLTINKELEEDQVRQDMLANSLITIGVRLFRLNVGLTEMNRQIQAASSKEVMSHEHSYSEHRRHEI
ncbi:DUF58 domain-containing protein [Paenibacillus sp. CMAA1364]